VGLIRLARVNEKIDGVFAGLAATRRPQLTSVSENSN
jgi:hypothetical protein